jgi:hypothetical protein
MVVVYISKRLCFADTGRNYKFRQEAKYAKSWQNGTTRRFAGTERRQGWRERWR